jgi:hypothetical protein
VNAQGVLFLLPEFQHVLMDVIFCRYSIKPRSSEMSSITGGYLLVLLQVSISGTEDGRPKCAFETHAQMGLIFDRSIAAQT